jgi:hypothetical protein
VARLLAELFVTLLVIDTACEFLLTYMPGEWMRIRCWDNRGETVA